MIEWISVSCNPEALSKASSFLEDYDGTLYDVSSFPGGVDGTIKMLKEKGNILVAVNNDSVLGVVGYTFGEPSKDFLNTGIAYVYITPSVRIVAASH